MALKSVSTAELRRELTRRERGARKLSLRRDKLARQLAALESELSDLGLSAGRTGRRPGRPPKAGRGGGRRRARNSVSLADAIARVVKVGATVSPADVASRVRKSGYKSTSAHFGMMVSNALSKDSRFKRLSRGQYSRTK
jgi:hypothetical protein